VDRIYIFELKESSDKHIYAKVSNCRKQSPDTVFTDTDIISEEANRREISLLFLTTKAFDVIIHSISNMKY